MGKILKTINQHYFDVNDIENLQSSLSSKLSKDEDTMLSLEIDTALNLLKMCFIRGFVSKIKYEQSKKSKLDEG